MTNKILTEVDLLTFNKLVGNNRIATENQKFTEGKILLIECGIRERKRKITPVGQTEIYVF